MNGLIHTTIYQTPEFYNNAIDPAVVPFYDKYPVKIHSILRTDGTLENYNYSDSQTTGICYLV